MTVITITRRFHECRKGATAVEFAFFSIPFIFIMIGIIEIGMQMDEKNPEPALRDEKLCGMQILYGFRRLNEKEWVDGKIYKADDGDTYSATITQIDDNRLRLRGYVGMPLFGKTQIWTRLPADHARCS